MKVELERLGRLLQVYLLAVKSAESMIMYLSREELYTVFVLITFLQVSLMLFEQSLV